MKSEKQREGKSKALKILITNVETTKNNKLIFAAKATNLI